MSTAAALPAPPAVQRFSINRRVEKLCEAIGSGPGDIELARYIATLEARIVLLEQRLTNGVTAHGAVEELLP